MKSDLIIQTLTNGRHNEWLAQCCRSVHENLPDGAYHVVQSCSDHQTDTLRGYSMGSLFTTVDHDDVVVNDSIRMCVKALEDTGAGIAFTYEDQMDIDGAPLPVRHGPVRYSDLAESPRAIHHLAVFRTECVSREVHRLSNEFGIGVDWITKAWVALRHGAVQVPIVGYRWRRHRYSLSCQQDRMFYKKRTDITGEILKWVASRDQMNEGGVIPQYIPWTTNRTFKQSNLRRM